MIRGTKDLKPASVVALLLCAGVLGRQGPRPLISPSEISRLSVREAIPGVACPPLLPFDFSSDIVAVAVRVPVRRENASEGGPTRELRCKTVLLTSQQQVVADVFDPLCGHVHFRFIEFSRDGKKIVANQDQDIVAYDPQTLHVVYRFSGETLDPDPQFSLGLLAAGLSRGGNFLAAAYWEHQRQQPDLKLHRRTRLEEARFFVFDLNAGKVVSHCSPAVKYGDSLQIAITSDGSRVAYVRQAEAKGSDRPNVFVVNSSDCSVVQTWSLPYPPSNIQLLPDDIHLTVTLTWGSFKAQELNVPDGAVVFQVQDSGKWGAHRPMAISHDGRWLALASGAHQFALSEKWKIGDPGVEIWDLQERRLAGKLVMAKSTDVQSWIPVPKFSSDDRTLAVTGPDCSLHFYSWQSAPSEKMGE